MDTQFEPIKNAAYAGDFELFTSLLNAEPTLINAVSKDRGDSPNIIQFVVVDGGLGKIPDPVKYLNFLIENGSTTEKQLVAAASVNARELVDTLLEAGVPLDDGAPWTAVEESLYWGHLDLAHYLIDKRGARLDTLCAAAMIGNLEKLSEYFTNGVLAESVLPIHFPWGPIKDSTTQDALNQAFFLAVRNKQFETAGYMLERGAEINEIAPGHHEQCTPLHQAAGLNDLEMADWLMDRGATVGKEDIRFKADAIEWAVHEGYPELAEHMKKRTQ